MKILGIDIETIPQEDISTAQQAFLAKRLLKNDVELYDTIPQGLINKLKATTPYLGEIICISVGEVVGNIIKTQSFIGDEKDLLTSFWSTIKDIGRTTFVTFNGLNFDVPFISLRSLHHGIKPSNEQFLNTRRFYKYPHFDVMRWISDWSYQAPSLDLSCDLVGVTSSKEGEIKAEDVYEAFKAGRIAEIADYCEHDVRATLEVYFKLKAYIRE